MKNKILVTGAAGFVGFHLTLSLLKDGIQVFGIDNLNDYYDVKLKNDRLNLLKKYPNFILKSLILVAMKIFQSHLRILIQI